MRRLKWMSLALITCIAALGSNGQQNGQNQRERPDDTQLYNPATVETLRGEVTSVEEMPPGKEPRRGTHLRLRTINGKTITVHLAPSEAMSKQEMQIRDGDHIEVTGSRVTMDGKPTIIARTLKLGDKVLTLRTATGQPIQLKVLNPEAQGENRPVPP